MSSVTQKDETTYFIKTYKLESSLNRERRILALLSFSPWIIKMYEEMIEESPEALSIALHRHDSDLMKFLIERNGVFIPTGVVNDLYKDLIRALTHCHGLQIIHADMKPENILVSKVNGSFSFVLCDFERSFSNDRNLHPDLAPPVKFRGTFAYMPPEAWPEFPPATFHSDIWGFGIVIFCAQELLPPYDLITPENWTEPVPNFQNGLFFNDECWAHSKSLEILVKSCLAFDPMLRPSASTLLMKRGSINSVESQVLSK